MQTPNSQISALFEQTSHYTKTSAELFKLKAIDKSADVLSTLVARLTVIILFSLCFLILNIGIALWIGGLLGQTYYGFFIVAGFYAILGWIAYIVRNRWIKAPLQNSIIVQALN